MIGCIDVVVDLIVGQGGDPKLTRAAVYYVVERTADLSVATAHSSPHSSPRSDPFLLTQLGLTRRQIGALLALLRGTRPVRRRGRTIGGLPAMVAVLATGNMTPDEQHRFERLARVAAGRGRGARSDAA